MGRAFILGDGQIGAAVAERLQTLGWTGIIAHRSARSTPAQAQGAFQHVALDRDDPQSFRQIAGGGFDAAVDTVAFHAGHARQWLEVQSSIGALVVISSGSVYADAAGRTLDEARAHGFPNYPVPIPETQTRTTPGDATYSTRKVELEDVLLSQTRTALTILRPFAVYGPKSRAPREWWFLARALAGQSVIPLAFEGRSRFQTSATVNIAELCRVALSRPGVRVLNAADPQALTVAEIGQAIFATLNLHLRLELLKGPPVGLKGRTPWTVERPIVADMQNAEALGYRPVADYRQLVGPTCKALIAEAEACGWRTAFPELSSYPPAMFEPAATLD